MPEIGKEEFKFPDETPVTTTDEKVEFEVEGEGDAEVEVVDDTPPEDRNRAPMKEPPAEVTDEELTQYSESVKKRIQHFSKGYHEERRAKEAALREREEALRLAQQVVEENKRLQGSLGQNQQVMLDQAKRVVANELEDAKRRYKEAYEAGDAEKLVEAQEALTAAPFVVLLFVTLGSIRIIRRHDRDVWVPYGPAISLAGIWIVLSGQLLAASLAAAQA